MNTEQYQEIIADLAGPRAEADRPAEMLPRIAQLLIKRRQEGRPLRFDEAEFLHSIAEAIDAERDSGAAWDLVGNVLGVPCVQAPKWFPTLYETVVKNIGQYSVAYITRREQDAINSGTLVSIGNRVFVMTAAHTIPPNPNGKMFFLSDTWRPFDALPARVITSGKEESGRPDVGFIELDPQFVQESLRRAPLPCSRLAVGRTGDTGKLCYIVGTPASACVRGSPQKGIVTNRFPLVGYFNRPVPPELWDTLGIDGGDLYSPRMEMDIFLPYPREDEMIRLGEDGDAQLPDPHGMSGCGLWQNYGSSELWDPDAYKLIGIQSRWPSLGAHLQATQVHHWLELIVSRCPEMRSAVADAGCQW